MDPVSVLLGLGTALKVVREVGQIMQRMHRDYETHTGGDKTLQRMALECNIYGECIKTIGYWLKRNQKAKNLARQMRTTHNAITLVRDSMQNVLLDLKRFRSDDDQNFIGNGQSLSSMKLQPKIFIQLLMKHAKLQLFRETMKSHLGDMRAHAAILHLTLGVIELYGIPSQSLTFEYL